MNCIKEKQHESQFYSIDTITTIVSNRGYCVDRDPPLPTYIKIKVATVIIMFLIYLVFSIVLISVLYSKKITIILLFLGIIVFIFVTIMILKTFQYWIITTSTKYHENMRRYVIPKWVEEKEYQIQDDNQWGISEDEIADLI